MTDYVISRKRSRPSGAYAIDPCLGYYVLQSHDSPEKSLNHSHCQRQHSSCRIENPEENNIAFLDDNCTIPSSLPEELELESPSTERLLDLDHENISPLEATDWIELIPSRTKPVVGLIASKSGSTTAPSQRVSRNNEVLPEEPCPLTVEEFLKRPTRSKSKARKTYRVKNIKSLKARAIKTAEPTKIGDNGQCDDGHEADALELRSRNVPRVLPSEDDPCDVGSSSPEHEPSSICDTPKITRLDSVKRKHKNFAKPLKARIYEAALATHVDPEDDFAQDEADPSRPPLRFLPGPAKNALRKRKTKSWSLVDPRKSKSICTASFASTLQRAPRQVANDGFASLSHTLDRLPMEIWKWRAGQGMPLPSTPNRRSLIKTGNRKAPQNQVTAIESIIPKYPPLVFVPWIGADSNYTALFRRKREISNNDEKAASKKRKQELLCGPSLQFSSLTDRPTERAHPSKRSKRTSVEAPMLTMLPIPNSNPTRSRSVSSPALRDMNYPSTPWGEVAQKSRDLSSPIKSALAARTPIAISVESSTALSSIFPFPAQQTIASRHHLSVDTQQHPAGPVISHKRALLSDKPLRPLESFMDEFLQNIRNVHGQTLEGKSKDKHSRPSKITRGSSRSPCVEGCSVDRSTLLSEVNTSGAEKSGAPPENSLSFDSQLSDWSTPNATESLEQCPSPDILSLLEPRNYQVVLGSR